MDGIRADGATASAAPRSTLTEGPVARALLSFALPAMAATALQSINGSINAMWIGHLVGKAGLAAASNVNLLVSLVHSLAFGFGMAVTILIARAMGAGDLAGVRRTFGAGIGLFSLAGLAFSIAGLLCVPAMLRVLDTPADAVPLALAYAHVSFAGLLPALLFAFLQFALRGSGDSRTPLLFIVPAALIDVALNPLLILGIGPFPQMGIAGSALASVIASSAGLAMVVAWIYARELPIRLRGPELRNVVPTPRLALAIVRQGIPMGLQMIMMSISSLAMLTLVNDEGTATVAAYAAVVQLWNYVQMPATGLGGAASTMAAQNIGGGRWDRVDRIAAAAAALGFTITAVGVLLILLLDTHALGLFFDGAHGDEMRIAQHINWRATWSLVLYGTLAPLVVIPRANGASVAPLLMMTTMLIPGRLGFAWLMRPQWGADAIWWSFPFSYAVAGGLVIGYYRHGGWRRLNVLPRLANHEEENP
jgi:putative MATE family efflux protein